MTPPHPQFPQARAFDADNAALQLAGMNACQKALVRDLIARVKAAEDRAHLLERELADTRRRFSRRIAYLERDKHTALERARKATELGRYWHGVTLAAVQREGSGR